jgi:hypothetical protein
MQNISELYIGIVDEDKLLKAEMKKSLKSSKYYYFILFVICEASKGVSSLYQEG